MAATSSAYGQYRQVQINTASPGKLILLLYQGAIKAMKQATDLIDRKDYEGKGNSLIKAQDIIMELNLALDMNHGEIPHSLRQLYLYIYKRLVDANLKVDKEPINECVGIMERLYEAWESAVEETDGNGPPQNAAASTLSITG